MRRASLVLACAFAVPLRVAAQADLTGDGEVGVEDLLTVLAAFGGGDGSGDADGDGAA